MIVTCIVQCVLNWLFLLINGLNVNYSVEDGIIQVVSQLLINNIKASIKLETEQDGFVHRVWIVWLQDR